ncbi:roadblock/LC7 domain-containing protein [Aquimarina algicola]|uniref:Roadblock/LC7 domain-containing protein n=1 Tax=Aquimarina algicola TaxID=2589995 RepID=A0A504JAM5_9FLAO|nr:hypothetical protein [Aquimarina algicola]TPN84593.1 hypothetical protein FHK87_16825 [Aquimarina algicola]
MISQSPLMLEKIIEFVGSEAVIVADINGNLIDSANIDFEDNIAAMTGMAFTMCKDLSEDLNIGSLEQLMAKTSDGFWVANRIQSDHIVIALCKDHSKLGLFLKKMNSLKTTI